MILKNNLYSILSADVELHAVATEEKTFRLALIPDSMIYRAHFPEQPITPGVCIIQTATELMADLSGHPVELHAVANAKFLAVIHPVDTPEVVYAFRKIAVDAESGDIRVSVTVSSGDVVFTKLSLVYRKR